MAVSLRAVVLSSSSIAAPLRGTNITASYGMSVWGIIPQLFPKFKLGGGGGWSVKKSTFIWVVGIRRKSLVQYHMHIVEAKKLILMNPCTSAYNTQPR
jgi:hypothetical protein